MKSYLRFLKFVTPHAWLFVLAIICMVLLSVFDASPLGLIIPLVDSIIAGKDIVIPADKHVPQFIIALVDKANAMPTLQLLKALIGCMVFFFLFKGIFDFMQTYLMSKVSQKVVRDVKNKLYEKLLHLSMDFYSQNPTGQLMSRITHDAAVIRDAISTGVADTFSAPIKILVYLFMLINIKIYFQIPWNFIIISLVIFPCILYPVIKIGKRLRKISTKSQEKMASINNMLLETISGIKMVKSFGMEDYENRRFRVMNQKFYRLMMQSIKRMKSVSPLTEFVAVACVSVIIWIAGKEVVTGQMSAGALASFLALVFMMMKPVKKLSNAYGINQQALAAADRIYKILDAPVSIREKDNPADLASFNNDIVFENISFKYDKENVLRGINLTVEKGEIVALVGPSGGGKTTLVNLLSRFYDPDAGSVRIDGVDIKDFSIRSLRAKIGLVSQETILFNDTLRANLCYGHENIDEGKLIESAEAANAHLFIKDFADGYDTVIGERGARLSGGQRQRLAIARALYKNPPILILDEATSQLDSESEKLVQDAINNLMEGRTVIAIAHRLSTITHADKIVVIDRGELVDIGTHRELLERSPLYKRLYEIQFADVR